MDTTGAQRAAVGTADVPPGWETAVIRFGQHVADALGIPLRLVGADPDTAFGMVALPVLLLLVVLATQLGTIARALGSRDFWRDGGRLTAVLQLGLLVVAYAFASGHQQRSFGTAVRELATGRLPDLLPRAVATQCVLLGVLWVVFGLLTGVDRRALLAPFAVVQDMLLLAALIVGFTVAWMAPPDGPGPAGLVPTAVAVAGVLLAYGYLTAVNRTRILRSPRALRQRRELLEHAARQSPGDPVVAAMAARSPAPAAAGPRRSVWLPAPRVVAGLTLFWAVLLCVPAGVAALVLRSGRFGTPTLGGVLRVEVLVVAVLLLITAVSFRRSLDDRARVSPAVPGLLDLSLLLSSACLALTAVVRAPVLLGPVPPWLLAVGPPLAVAALVFVLRVRPHRRVTRRWSLVLPAALAAAVLVLPLRGVVTPVFDGLTRALVG
ncbi:hypothetical protein KNE206_42740 [Kitasatospora sp. NE20-6]|uniref:hypothetical protein n=1 Tax=Kitasatospora sp. NE20-6 TaxID=2859066 RepID=UPI0034DBE8F1